MATLALALASLLTTAADWPTYLHDAGHSANNPNETILSPANAGQLAKLWAFNTGSVIAAGATVVGTTVYVGSWDGNEYALDANTGALEWKTYLGVTIVPGCGPSRAGISSTAAVQNGVVYVGGGDSYWYALDAATGAILWKVFTGDNSPSGGHYNWSSPLLYNGYAYIGVASEGDCPLVQGQLLRVNLSTHQVTNTFNVVPNGQVGGGIWTSPALDAATNTIFVSTGTKIGTEAYAQAILALDATTLTLKDSWQLPAAQEVADSDWGSSPTLLSDPAGDQLVAVANKNGILYCFNRNSLAAGPVWQRQVAIGGEYPLSGDGTLSSATVDNGTLYMAGGDTTINGTSYTGSVRALDPATGNFLWEHGSPGTVLAALASANGLVVAGAGSTLEVLNAATGVPLFTYLAGAVFYGPPSIANGIIYVGSTDGHLYAFGIPAPNLSPTPTPTATAVSASQAGSIDLSTTYNNAGISSDTNTTTANFDGQFNSYSREALQSVGIVQGQPFITNDATYYWPNTTPGNNDNVIAAGQPITPPTPIAGTTLAFLGATSGGPVQSTGIVTYTTGVTQTYTLNLSDWTLGAGTDQPSPGNTIVATMSHRNSGSSQLDPTRTFVFSVSIPLQSGATVQSLTLPGAVANHSLHIFALNVTTPGSSGPPTTTPSPTITPTPVPGQVGLAGAFNNVGISDDRTSNSANFDSQGYSYSAQALQAAGYAPGHTVVANGVSFTWPNVASGSPDNVNAQGQVITLPTPIAGTTLAFLGAASGAVQLTGSITYGDGTTQSYQLGLSDWALGGVGPPPAYGNAIVATMPYRNRQSGIGQTINMYLFEASVPLTSGKAVASITLPNDPYSGGFHIFALSVVTNPTGTPTPSPTITPSPTTTSSPTITPTAGPGQMGLAGAFNNVGISDDRTSNSANFDHQGYSYSAQALQAVGYAPGHTVVANGVSFTWPNVASGSPDNVNAQGQVITLPTPIAGTTLAFLGAASGAVQLTGSITYGDGTTQSYQLGLSDWALGGVGPPPAYGNAIVATMPYRNQQDGSRQSIPMYLFEASVPLTAGKPVASVTLPNDPNPAGFHLFALSVVTTSPGTPTSTPTVTVAATGTPTATGSPPGTLTTPASPTWTPSPSPTLTPAPGQAGLAGAFNNVGISDDRTSNSANFDHQGYSYSAQALQAAGYAPGHTVVANGVSFTWPNVASGSPDNVNAQGQVITLPTPIAGTTLAFLGAASGAVQLTGSITYGDGTTQSYQLGLSDWALDGVGPPPAYGNAIVATMPYRNQQDGSRQSIPMYLFEASVPLTAGKPVASVTLPNDPNPAGFHLFALSVVTTSPGTPTATPTATGSPTPSNTPIGAMAIVVDSATPDDSATPTRAPATSSTPTSTPTTTSSPSATTTPSATSTAMG